MSILYIITNTIGVDQFTILPGALNGPEGPTANTDLRLYGQGATLYGEGVNENIYKLTESFACPEKGGTPGTPQDEVDLAVTGAGINNPLDGQPWFNTTTNKLMIFDSVGGFQFVGAPIVGLTPPASPTEGDLWYDTSLPQLKVYDGASWLSTADRYVQHNGTVAMTGALNLNTIHKIINLAEPTSNQDAATKFFVDALRTDVVSNGLLDSLYINATVDDLMNANLTMEGGKTITFGTNLFPTMVFGKGNGLPGVGANIEFEQASGLIAAGTDIRLHVNAIGTGGDFVIAKDSGAYKIDGLEVDVFTVESSGRIKANIANYTTLVDADDVLANKKYVDDAVGGGSTPIGGIIMYSGLFSAIPANWQLCDGTSGTPNLTDKFIYGTNTEGQLETTGGTADAVNVSHNHTFTGNLLPTHNHNLGAGLKSQTDKGDGTTAFARGLDQRFNVNEDSVSAGTPTGTVVTSGVSGTGQNIPPYVKLAYIQRLS